MNCETSAACDSHTDASSYEERRKGHLLDERGGLERICLRATRQIGFDSMSLNCAEVPAVQPCPGYVFDTLFTHQGDPPRHAISTVMSTLPMGRMERGGVQTSSARFACLLSIMTEPYEAQTAALILV
jgi:hypothetical protein